jgi:hypothetical protein
MSIHLVRTDESAAEIDALASELERVGVEGVLADLDQQAHRTGVPGRLVDHGFRWSWRDVVDLRWWPQGISTSADADAAGEVDGRRVLLSTWYSRSIRGLNKGSRVTFVDLGSLRYRHVLLVRPVLRDGRIDLEPLHVHAGGAVWCGGFVHVAATGSGFLSCRLDDLMRVPDSSYVADRGAFGRTPDDRLATYGYRYLLPVRVAHEARSEEGFEGMRYSFLSLDRDSEPPALVAGEYGRGTQTTRLARFPLDPETWLPAADADGVTRPLLLEDGGEQTMQGAVVVGDRWFVTSSRGHLTLSSLYAGRPGSWVEHPRALPMGAEDITWSPATELLWSQSEFPLARWVFAVRRDSVDF